jgi:hypothetical protein
MRERLRVLRHPAFRNPWLASSTSVMGHGIVVVALALPVGLLAAGPAAEATSPETVIVVGGILTDAQHAPARA